MIGKIKRRIKALRPKSDYIIYNNYCIPREVVGRNCAQTILSGEVHEKETAKAIHEHYRGGAIVHAGTFFGDMLPHFKYVKKVYAFEPNLISFKATQVTMFLQNINNVELYNYALGSNNKRDKLKIKRRTWLGGGSYISDEGEQKIEVKKLDDIIDKKVSVMHLDVEGYETEVLKGAEKIIKKFNPVLILESYDKNYLDGIGYKFIKRVNFNFIFENVSKNFA